MHLIFQQYEERLTRRGAKPRTLRNYRRTGVLLEESGLDPTTAKDWQLEEWLAGLPMAPRTKRMHAENLSAVCGYAVKRGVLERDPTDDIRLPREPDEEPKIVPNAELRRLLARVQHDEDELMITLAIYTGLRKMELQNLKWSDCTPTTITVRRGKGDKLRHVPVHPALSEVLLRSEARGEYVLRGRYADRPISQAGIHHRLDRVRGDVDCAFHDFRRTVATSLAENDVAERIIDKIMGWAPRTVRSRHYVRVADASMQEAILKLYADDPLSRAP